MEVHEILHKIAERLPGGQRIRVLIKCIQLYRDTPHLSTYRTLVKLNLRAYFCIHPHYGPMLYKYTDAVPQLYHVTSEENLSSTLRHGLCNKRTGIIFLTDSTAWAARFAASKMLAAPALLQVNTKDMQKDGYAFFSSPEKENIWLTKEVPAKYLSVVSYFDAAEKP